MPKSARILVTGSRGFVGRNLVPVLQAEGFLVHELNRSDVGGSWDGMTPFSERDLRCDTLVHLAARVHVMRETESEATMARYWEANVAAFRELVRSAAEQGLKRVIFVSTAKVLGEGSMPGAPLTDATPPDPQGSYAISKHEAEKSLHQLATEVGVEFITLRPPLIYGPGVKANFLSLAKAVLRGVPIPVPAEANRRSLLSVENLAAAIVACLQLDRLPNQEFLVADGAALSTEELVQALGLQFGKRPKLLKIPEGMGGLFHSLPIVGPKWARLSGSFEIDANGLATLLGNSWTRKSTAEGLKQVFAS